MKTECAEGERGSGTEWRFTLRHRCEGHEDQARGQSTHRACFCSGFISHLFETLIAGSALPSGGTETGLRAPSAVGFGVKPLCQAELGTCPGHQAGTGGRLLQTGRCSLSSFFPSVGPACSQLSRKQNHEITALGFALVCPRKSAGSSPLPLHHAGGNAPQGWAQPSRLLGHGMSAPKEPGEHC